jgi:predicted DNA-binding transcriptional regulator AlpA
VAQWTLDGPDAAILTKREVAEFLKLSTRALDRLIEQGVFPRPRRRGKQATWTGGDLAAYLALEGRYRAGPPDDEKGDDGED